MIPHKYQMLILADHIKSRGNLWIKIKLRG